MISLLQEGAEGVKSGSDFSTISLGVTQFLKSLTRNSPRLVLLEVSKVDTLFSISDSQQLAQIDARGGEAVRILSQVVSVFAKNVKNRFMSEGINITLRHLAVQNDVKKVCILSNSIKAIDKQKNTGMCPLGLAHQLLDDGGSDHVGQQREPHHLFVQLPLHLRRHADEEPRHGLQLPRHPHRLHPPGHRHVFHCNDCHYLLAADQGRESAHWFSEVAVPDFLSAHTLC